MCRVLKVNVSSYYHWIKMGCVLEKVDTILNELIEDIFNAGRQAYGQRRIKEALVQRYGLIVSKRRIAKIMKSLNLVPKMKRRFRVNTTDSKHSLPIAPNLLNRDFYAGLEDTVYAGDITYIDTKEGWLYLATVLDLYSRKIIGTIRKRITDKHSKRTP